MNKGLTKISEIIEEISMGPFGSDIKVDNFVESGVPVLNGANLQKFKLLEEEFRYVTQDKAKTFRKAIAKRGDIVITHRGTLGQISYIPDNSKFEEYVISQSQFRVALNRKLVDPAFFVYYFHTTEGQKRLLANKCHVGVPALAQATTNFRLIEIPLPSLPTQQKIASVLSALDSKIELNNRINAELEMMAKTLYNYWFVQFDFPDKNGKPYKSSGGKMVWNEELKREIPEGWEVNKIDTVTKKINSGGTPSTIRKDFYSGNISWYATNELQDDFLIGSKNLITDIALNESSAKLFPADTILIAIYAAPTVGRLGMLIEESTFNQACCGMLADENIVSKEYLFLTLLSMRKQFNSIAVGTAQKNLSVGQLKNLYILVPPQNINNFFKLQTKELFKKKLNNQLENQKLNELRDWLLPMLMNGQVKVKDEKESELSMAAEPKKKYGK